MKHFKIALLGAIIAIMAVMAPISPLKAAMIGGDNTPLIGQKSNSTPIIGAVCIMELAHNIENPDGELTEAEIVDNCCPDLDACQAEIERLKKDPPEIPAKSWLMFFGWFRDLDPGLQTMIGGIASLIIAGGFTYLGTLGE